MPVKPIPEGYHSVTPYLVVEGVAALIDFLKQAFDATQVVRMSRPDGKLSLAPNGELEVDKGMQVEPGTYLNV